MPETETKPKKKAKAPTEPYWNLSVGRVNKEKKFVFDRRKHTNIDNLLAEVTKAVESSSKPTGAREVIITVR